MLKENRWDKYVTEELSNLPNDKFIRIVCALDQEHNNIKININGEKERSNF